MTDSKAQWTLMIYMAGDNDLSTAGDRDLVEMRTVGSTGAVNVVAEFDNAGSDGTRRFHIRPGGQDELVVSLGETDSGHPQTLLDFIHWTAQKFPAERYGLVLWNHGSGWEPALLDTIAQEVGAPNYNPREASERSATPLGRVFFRTSLESIFSLPSPDERAICSDDGSGHSLDTIELGRVLALAVDVLGQQLDFLGMDACLMSNLEVAYQARPFARYMVASEENEPNDGWPYDRILSQLVAQPEKTTEELVAGIVQAYMESYTSRGYEGAVTQSALDLSQVKAFALTLDELAEALIERAADSALEMWRAQRQSARFWHNTLWDLQDFCRALEEATGSERVRSAASAVREALSPGKGRFVVAEGHSGQKVARCGGLTAYLVPPLVGISRYYPALEFSKQHRWLALLEAYHAA